MTSKWRSRLRGWLRAKLGRTRLERIENQLVQWNQAWRDAGIEERLNRLESRLEARIEDLEERLENRTDERRQLGQHLLDAVGRIEQDRLEVTSNLERFREVLEDGPRVLATLDNRILRYCEITDRVDDGLGRLLTAIREVSEHVERRHAEWTARWKEIRVELDGRAEREALEEERDGLDRKVRSLSDQCAHLIDILGQTRRQMNEMRETADQVHETRAEKAGLEAELADAKGEIEEVRKDLAETLRASEALVRVRDALRLELKRVQAQRDRILTGQNLRSLDGESTESEGS